MEAKRTWWAALDSSGNIRAVFDSEPEAHFYVHSRGHMHEGSYQPFPCNPTAAPSLLAACEGLVRECPLPADHWLMQIGVDVGDAYKQARDAIAKATA